MSQYHDEIGDAGSDPLPVIISERCCEIHGFHFISYPREMNAPDKGYIEKCPLRGCAEGF